MIADRRTLTYVAIALIVGASLALAVALARSGPSVPASSAGSAHQAAAMSTSGVLADTTGADTVATADPARVEPMLDKFVAKNPFIPLASATAAPTPTPSPTSSTTLTAKVKVNGTSYTVDKDDKVPTGSPAFTIAGITTTDVSFAVINGAIENGAKSVTVNLGESVRVTLDNGKSYDLSVISIGKSGSGTVNGHSISVLSITSSNGKSLVTLEVDGKTYADLQVGDVISTSAGDIEIISINVSAQTVTIIHGDQTIVLHAGQVIIK